MDIANYLTLQVGDQIDIMHSSMPDRSYYIRVVSMSAGVYIAQSIATKSEFFVNQGGGYSWQWVPDWEEHYHIPEALCP